jgi:thiamine biosynthesis protein ThiS
MKFFLNGETVENTERLTVEKLLELYSLDKRKIAVEKNLEIVTRANFHETYIDEGDRIEIIHFIGGG